MKNIFFLFIFIFFYLWGKSQDNRTAPLTNIVQNIANSWQDADAGNTSNVELSSVTATFTVSNTTSKGGEIKIWIFKLGRKTDKKNIHTITLKLSKGNTKSAFDRVKGDSSEELTKFINAALSDFKKLNDANLLEDLKERELTLEIGLTITKNTIVSGGYEIGIFSLAAEAGKNKEQGHTLTLVFKKK